MNTELERRWGEFVSAVKGQDSDVLYEEFIRHMEEYKNHTARMVKVCTQCAKSADEILTLGGSYPGGTARCHDCKTITLIDDMHWVRR